MIIDERRVAKNDLESGNLTELLLMPETIARFATRMPTVCLGCWKQVAY